MRLIDTSTAYDLSASQPVFLNLEQGTSAIFRFEATLSQAKIQIKVWERGLRQGFSDIDVFITVNNEEINESSYTWKFKFGSGPLVEIYPDDANY